jgi:hypothetical protein
MKPNKSRSWIIAAGLGLAAIIFFIVIAAVGLYIVNNINQPASSLKPSVITAAGPVAVTGTYEVHSDITSTNDAAFVHTKIDMVAPFTAKSGDGNTMTGEAQVTFTESYEFGGQSCKISWSTGDVTWSPKLSGTFQKNADGSITVSLLADPQTGPSFSEDHLCLGKIPENAAFPGAFGTLVNGLFDSRQDIPMTGGLTGTSYYTWHMQLTPGK